MQAMRKYPISLWMAPFIVLILAQPAVAATFSGTVTNATYNKPSPGDSVTLIGVQAGMADIASATTDASGHYSLDGPGMGPYLIRVTHQGAGYFIAAPQGGAAGDVTVYDVAAQVAGVSIDADMLLIESGGGVLRIRERYLIRNTSMPPRAQFGANTFEVAIPPDAELDGASATRPGGMSTVTRLLPLAEKGHYTFNVPIQPDKGETETLFELQYHLPYTGKYTFSPRLQMPADNLVVYAAKGIQFSNAGGATFQPTQEDPRVETYVARNVHPGQAIRFTVSGDGQMASNQPGNPMAGQAAMGDTAAMGNDGRPGGGLGVPIGTPDPLTRYKWWLLALISALMLAAGYFLLRRGRGFRLATPDSALPPADAVPYPELLSQAQRVNSESRVASGSLLLNSIKEELFAIESEKLTGTLLPEEYSQIKTGLEAVLKRELKRRAVGK
jgi:hypothetical protein